MDTEKQHADAMDHNSNTPSDEAIKNGQGAVQGAQEPWASVPKRKPVPLAKGPRTESAAVNAGTAVARPSADAPKRVWPFGLGGFSFRAQRRSRKFLIIGVVAAVLLIALIIGLAVGLTVGKKKASNLPLPTSNGGPYEGDLTYYNPGLGACGYTNSGSDMVCAVSHILFDAASTGSDPNDNPLCGMKLRLRRNGKSVDVKVVDRCVGCAVTDLDVTEAVFEEVAELAQGRVKVEWAWLEKSPVSAS
ncbi:uncharacterized protein N7498_005199 [Penicillium cinerascens]|uniref:RlpA-like protein double-psi beta-barrel domain-containing protein n=1 Tax=Penicillium cinerascens TaxID=70096 RepID=A0A9W9T0B6_9EURO|nr:uncharacterized protein N7498_005199 [Penicillium cinerascens]KAJ5204320.1 hypothetical protein N7498_005199 [Penicillium cinerascens]